MARDAIGSFLRFALIGMAAALVLAEVGRPLRRRQREPKLRRMQRNAVIGGLGALAVQLCEQPIVFPLARYVERRQWGLLRRSRLPAPVTTVLALVALDYTLYLWHIIVHRLPWRC